ncbi:MAG: mannose-1-phosphate guanylyltransferase/mannose-6-phosphate isomerase [Pseudomonadales bacterium]|nr:mannose-1-phosphate guanylyltransferase/mannose-6-phosphate isomerase [Pseudomonadales bacterium]
MSMGTSLIPVILSGGSGSRLWPLSRAMYPKQLLPLAGSDSMLQDTIGRLAGLAAIRPPIVVCNEDHRFMVAEQLRENKHKAAAIILEPVGRNTAPAVAVAAFEALRSSVDDMDPMILVLPADHVIEDIPTFHRAIEQGMEQARAGNLVTFGIVPQSAHTGYGYIRAGDSMNAHTFRVDQFREKPDQATADSYLEKGGYYWNSGMFLFKASRYLQELAKFAPKMQSQCMTAYSCSKRDMDFTRLDTESFEQCPSDSIDYAVMEKTDCAVVIPLDAGWNDVGSWSSLWELGEPDEQGNVVIGDVLSEDTHNSYLRSENRLIATVGIKDCVVVDTADALLVADRNQVQDVKGIVEQLKKLNRSETTLHKKVYRPWGSYEGIAISQGYQAKRITVNPGGCLSLQLHHKRSEHWIVVKGVAEVTCSDKIFELRENESTYIPIGEKHRLENRTDEPVEMIEVQVGSYLGEDDIVRFEDVYGRTDN